MRLKSIIIHTVALTFVALFASQSVLADVVNIREDAPQTYVVEKGDTLWDISSLFLSQPWRWPELWRNNTQIENPHLIYPGDMLRLRWENGVPILEVVRDKPLLTLSPDTQRREKPNPINVLPWEAIAMYINNDSIMTTEEFQALPAVLSDREGSARFVDEDYVLTKALKNAKRANMTEFEIVRKEREVYDSLGALLGVQVIQLSDAEFSTDVNSDKYVVKVANSIREVKKGDKLRPAKKFDNNDLTLQPATRQRGELVSNINGYNIISKDDVVIINIGKRKVEPGTVFGIYKQGPDIEYKEEPLRSASATGSIASLFSLGETIQQPAYKVGELVVIRGFEHASYAWVTEASTHLVGGEIVASPTPSEN
ncbi:LysM peptidoglycan-binding domain-containing protein [Glaciecola siphonariae]|uniref:LysM peptidoglycan-binding domain-containing protein n=1 Tax=Glaciecola siphonariae TaxID=521012 RepID=A0ABV9LQN0_9ALTE